MLKKFEAIKVIAALIIIVLIILLVVKIKVNSVQEGKNLLDLW
ncbi:MAG: hypothetical protein UX74_C0027G0007 [Parcubacteria group bacterium GW2011_GWA2_47_10b]|nr:MAG: hypothetical protein UX74_C0027G0007 [Parcubacteria group bacterium GW2011_GWA2_47_10b]